MIQLLFPGWGLISIQGPKNAFVGWDEQLEEGKPTSSDIGRMASTAGDFGSAFPRDEPWLEATLKLLPVQPACALKPSGLLKASQKGARMTKLGQMLRAEPYKASFNQEKPNLGGIQSHQMQNHLLLWVLRPLIEQQTAMKLKRSRWP